MINRNAAITLFTVILQAMPSLLLADTADSILAGERIRIWRVAARPGTAPQSRRVATFVTFSRDSLYFVAEHDENTASLPMSSIRRIDRSIGIATPGRRVLTGAEIGGCLGFAVGGLTMLVLTDESDRFNAESYAIRLAGATFLGTVVGAIVGSATRTEGWRRIPPDSFPTTKK